VERADRPYRVLLFHDKARLHDCRVWELLIELKSEVEVMPSVDVGGISLYFEKSGSGEPIVFCHGIPTDYRAWSAQVEALSESYTTITYSRRYAAPNQREGDLADSTIENNAADLKGIIDKLGVSPVHLVGHSYGGFISAYVAATRPELIRSLVLVEPAIATLLVENPTSSAQVLSLLFRSPSVALSARRFQTKSLAPALKAFDAGQLKTAAQLNVDGVQDMPGAFEGMPDPAKKMFVENGRTVAEQRTKFPPFRSMITKISCRTLVINGGLSPLWLRRIGELAVGYIAGSEAVKIPDARHFPHMERAPEFNGTLQWFISKG
jgi:pimeloyl-ACP methyl ester carboxylesterase